MPMPQLCLAAYSGSPTGVSGGCQFTVRWSRRPVFSSRAVRKSWVCPRVSASVVCCCGGGAAGGLGGGPVAQVPAHCAGVLAQLSGVPVRVLSLYMCFSGRRGVPFGCPVFYLGACGPGFP